MRQFISKNGSNLAFALAILMLLGILTFVALSLQTFIRSHNLVSHTLTVRETLSGTLSLVTSAEAGVRGYIITGDEKFLEDYFAATQSENGIQPHIQTLRQLTVDDPHQWERLGPLEILIARKLATLERNIDLRKNSGFEAAQEAVASGEGKETMDEIRTIIAEMNLEAANLLKARLEASAASLRNVLLALGIGGPFALLLVSAPFYFLNRQIGERRRAQEQSLELNRELETVNKELKAANNEFATANKELEAFSYSVSHDLRAPLRAIDGFSRILMEEYAPQLAPEALRYLQLVRDNTVRMGNLVDDLLAFSRLSRQAPRTRSVKTTELIRQVLDELGTETNGRQAAIEVAEMPECQADPNLLKQVWINLLSNALKYTRQRDPARIEIGWKKENGEQVFFVKDNGAGFDMQYADKLFGIFQRLHRSEEYEGTGIGLAIVQRIVHRHGGRVWAEGQVDEGAAFYFSLPFVEPEAPPPVIEKVDEVAERARELV